MHGIICSIENNYINVNLNLVYWKYPLTTLEILWILYRIHILYILYICILKYKSTKKQK